MQSISAIFGRFYEGRRFGDLTGPASDLDGKYGGYIALVARTEYEK
jgi:hypothetical protein